MPRTNYFLPTLNDVEVRTRGYLPHWEAPDAIYSITYRLHDSLPQHIVHVLREERRAIERMHHHGATAIDRARIRFAVERSYDRALDLGHGAAHLGDDRIATVVVENMSRSDGDRYDLLAWCVMPTHVHVVLQARGAQSLARIVQAWKSYTAKRANELLGRDGVFWAREYYDRMVRGEEDLNRTIEYVVTNPAKAGLIAWPWVWVAGGPPAERPAGGRRS